MLWEIENNQNAFTNSIHMILFGNLNQEPELRTNNNP